MCGAADKPVLRQQAIARRRGRSSAEIVAARLDLTAQLLPILSGRGVICLYSPLPSEPLDPDLAGLVAATGTTVLLPMTRQDAPLDWVEFGGSIRPGSFGIAEPIGASLGPDAVVDAEVVLVPAFLVDAVGHRLGRGGGHYDRTLVGARGLTIGVVFDDETVDKLPAGPFDQALGAVATPTAGLTRLPRG